MARRGFIGRLIPVGPYANNRLADVVDQSDFKERFIVLERRRNEFIEKRTSLDKIVEDMVQGFTDLLVLFVMLTAGVTLLSEPLPCHYRVALTVAVSILFTPYLVAAGLSKWLTNHKLECGDWLVIRQGAERTAMKIEAKKLLCEVDRTAPNAPLHTAQLYFELVTPYPDLRSPAPEVVVPVGEAAVADDNLSRRLRSLIATIEDEEGREIDPKWTICRGGFYAVLHVFFMIGLFFLVICWAA